MAHRLDHVAGAGFTFRADHRRALRNPAQRLAEVAAAADKRHFKGVLVDVIGLVSGGQHFALVYIVHTEHFQDLRLDKVADAALRHHRDRHRLDDALDHVGVAHAGHAAMRPDVGGHALQRHHRHSTRLFGDPGLLRRDHVHDHAALEHLGEALLGRPGGLFDAVRFGILVSVAVIHTLLLPPPGASFEWQFRACLYAT